VGDGFDDGMGEDGVEAVARGREALGARAIHGAVVGPRMADGMVVGVTDAVAGQLAGSAAEAQKSRGVLRVAGGGRGAQEPVVGRRNHPEGGARPPRIGETSAGGTYERAGDRRGGGLGGGGAGGGRERGDEDQRGEHGAQGGQAFFKPEEESRRRGPGPRRRPRV
jgi:hypothetical protein